MVQKRLFFKAFAGLMLFSSAAMADYRQQNQQRTPVDTRGATGQRQGSSFFTMSINLANQNADILVCDVFAQTSAMKRGSSTTVEVKKFVLDAEIEVDQVNTINFQFRSANFGRGYLPSRKAARVYSSCVTLDTYNPDQGASGNCDPRQQGADQRHCDNTCVAYRQNPEQCAARSQNGPQWPDDGLGAEDQPGDFWD